MKRKTTETMRPIVEAFSMYKGSKKAFCRERGIAPHTLDYWRRKFNGELSAGPAFIALEVDRSFSGRSIEFHYPNGVRVVAPMEASTALLQNLINIAD